MSKARDIADLDFNAPDIDGGNIDGAVIGGTTAAAGTFTSGIFTGMKVNGSFTVNGNVDTSSNLGEVLQLSQTDSIGGFLWSVDRASNTYKHMTYHASRHKFYSDATTERMSITSSGIDVTGTATFSSTVSVAGVGVIGATDGDLNIYSTAASHGGLRLGNGYIAPTNNAGTITNDAISLGLSGQRFTSLYLTDSVQNSGKAGSATVFNEDATSADFRVESASKTHMLFVDGGLNAVGIGTSAAGSFTIKDLVVGDGTGARGITIYNAADNEGIIRFADGISGNQQYRGQIKYNHAEDSLNFHTTAASSSAENLKLSSTEAVFNEGGVDTDFRVESDTKTHGLFLDASTNILHLGGSTQATSTSFLNCGGVTFSNGSAPTNHFFSWDNEGAESNQQLVAYYFDGAYRSRMSIGGNNGITSFNDSSVDIDFRVQSDGNANMLFVDGGNNHVSIGTSSDYGGALNVNGGLNSKQAVFTSTNNRGLALSTASRSGQNDGVAIIDAQDTESTGGRLELHTMGVARASFERDQIIFNGGGNDQDFRVQSDSQTGAIFVDASNDSVQILGNKFLEPVSAYYISSGTLNRNITVGLNGCGEYYIIMHIVGIWPYSGSNPGTRIIEVAGFGSSNVINVIRNTHYGSGPTGAVTVSATGGNLVVNIVTGQNYRWAAHCEVVHGGGGMSMSVDGNNG